MSVPASHFSAGPADLAQPSVLVAEGDGIGPEIMQATLAVLREADSGLAITPVTLGLKAYQAGHLSGVDPGLWAALGGQPVLLKAPISTPQGGGYKSVNVTLRKTLGLYANVRPCIAYAPFVPTRHPGMDVVIVRENEEDTYAGIEHRQTNEVVQCLKLVSRPGCERVVRHAFEYARAHGRRKVTCMTKDNIMKLTDGLFRQVFEEVAKEHPDIESEHLIVDIGTARMATRPERFDVVVTPNLYGDILSDVAAEVAGSIGLAGSANIGQGCAMFEAVHGSAPDIAGRDLANPSGLLLSAVMMLAHLGRGAAATAVHNAWLRTLEDGLHTPDIFREGSGTRCVGTKAFARGVIERLGKQPEHLAPKRYPDRDRRVWQAPEPVPELQGRAPMPRPVRKSLAGVDVFLHWDGEGRDPQRLAGLLEGAGADVLQLALLTNRGVRVWPDGNGRTLCTDHWRCRFLARSGEAGPRAVADLLMQLAERGLEAVKTENLYAFDGKAGYSQAQGE